MEIPHDVHDVAPYDNLISKEMKPWFAKALKEMTLDDVSFENREVYEPDTRDARDSMRYMSAFHRQPGDHYREERDARMGTIAGGTQKECEPKNLLSIFYGACQSSQQALHPAMTIPKEHLELERPNVRYQASTFNFESIILD